MVSRWVPMRLFVVGVVDGLTFRWWKMKFGSTLGVSLALHANTLTFFLRNSVSSSFSWGGNWEPIWKNFSGSLLTTTFSRSSHFDFSIDPLSGNTRVFDCYKTLFAEAEDSTLGWCKMAATMHSLAMDWLPTISLTWPFDGYFTFWCRVEETAPKA